MAPALSANSLGMWQETAQIIRTIEEAHSSGEVVLGAEETLEESFLEKRETKSTCELNIRHALYI